MEKSKSNRIQSCVIFSLLLVFGFYTSTIMYADAVSVVSVTFPTGSTTLDVAYRDGLGSNNNETSAYVIGANGGQAFVWRKSGSGITENTIIANVTLTGSASARAIEFVDTALRVYAVTNDKFWALTTTPSIITSRAEGVANIIRQLKYDTFLDTLFYCTNDGYGEINLVTLAPTTLYSEPTFNSVLDCAFDGEAGFAYLAGIDLGTGVNADLIKIDLDTHTQVDTVAVPNFGFGVCLDTEQDFVWLTESSDAKVRKYDMATLTLNATITVGTTPRFCTIEDGDQARRLYVANEGTDNVSIVDIDANAVLFTPSSCNQGVTTPRIDSKRLFNTTNAYIPCPETTNSIIIDDTVSEEIPTVDPNDPSCDNPANADLLRCVLGDDELTGVGEEVGAGIADVACNVIFANCSEDTDPATNGIGLLMFIASIFVVVGMFYYAVGTEAFHMPIFIWMIIILALSAFFTISGLIDPVFLILAVVALIALAVPKLISTVRGGGTTFGGGSSA